MQSMLSKYKKLSSKRREQGLTLIEASMVLALSAVVVAGVMLYYQSASDNNRLQSGLGELGSIQTAVQTLYAGQANYTGLDNTVLAGNSSIPPSMQGAAGVITNPWGSAVTIAVAGTTAASEVQYTVEFDGVPDGACTPFSSQQLGSQMVALSINGTASTAWTPSTAQAKCTGGNNALIWTLK